MTYRAKRRLARYLIIVVFFGIPFINIGGNPLLRFDFLDKHLYILGIDFSTGQIFPLMLLFFSFLFFFIYITQLFGRVWCGWLCPQTFLLDIYAELSFVDHPFNDEKLKRYAKKAFNVFAAAFISLALTVGLMLLTVSPSKFIQLVGAGDVFFLWYVLTLVVFLDILFIGRKFCRTVCPYAIVQSVMYDADTMRIGMHPDREVNCIQCDLCVDVCPTGIDIKEGLSSKCVSCAECIDACAGVMKDMDNPPCIDYYFGQQKLLPFRANKAITLFLAVLFFLGSIFAVTRGESLVIQAGVPVYTGSFYEVDFTFENKGEEDVTVVVHGARDIDKNSPRFTYTIPAGRVITAKAALDKLGEVKVHIFKGRDEKERVIKIKEGGR